MRSFTVRVAVIAALATLGAGCADPPGTFIQAPSDCLGRGPGADLHGCDLSNLDLVGIDLSGANLRHANLSGAFLTFTTLFVANLTGIISTGAVWTQVECPNGAFQSFAC